MTERPILFSGPMVRALLDGTKTQTRRIVKDLPPWQITEIVPSTSGCGRWLPNGPAPSGRGMASGHWRPCPYGQPGDRLWVRETWARAHVTQAGQEWFVYREGDNRTDYGGPWKPSIHMPRAASRILLEITGVRVERLQDISDQDAIAEGIRRVGPGWERWHPDPDDIEHTGSTQKPRLSYQGLWESINGAGSWDANPWVWVVEFRRIER